MRLTPCPFADATAGACLTNEWEDSLLQHAASCPDCQDTMLAFGALRTLAREPAGAALPDPGLLFRKGQILARFRQEDELARRAMQPVRVTQWAAFAAALAGLAWAALQAGDVQVVTALGSTAAALAVAVTLRLLWAED
jgi:hypothetical protein